MIAQLSDTIHKALQDLPLLRDAGLTQQEYNSAAITPCQDRNHGDLSTNIAFIAAKKLKKNPRELAQDIAAHLNRAKSLDSIETVEAAANGFINFHIKKTLVPDIAQEIVENEVSFGSSDLGKGSKVLIEFVSANPTGPLTIAHGRQAAVGDALARMLVFCGYDVHKEYYLNDRGRQIDLLGLSTLCRYRELLGLSPEFPDEGYKGDYVYAIAKKAIAEFGQRYKNIPDTEAAPVFSEYAMGEILTWIKKDLADFGVSFDSWFSERTLAESIETTLSDLKHTGHAYFEDGAWWLKSSAFGDDKNRVLVKKNGDYTYLLPDLTYHREKFRRGYTMLINLWGPDHHGYIPRIKAGSEALGNDPAAITVLIVQLTTLFRGKEKLSMSTRAGSFISLRDLMDEVGIDPARFFFLNIKPESHFDFDLELAKKQTMDNPVYYLQYAYARICSIIKKHEETAGQFDVKSALKTRSLLMEDKEHDLLFLLDQFSAAVQTAVRTLEPNKVIAYCMKLVSAFHSYYNAHRVISDNAKLTQARMLLLIAIKTVIEKALGLLGISTPKSM